MLWKWREKRLQHAWPVHYVTICSNNLQLYLNVFTRVSSSIYNLISLIFHLFFHFALPIVLFFNFFMWVTVHSDSYGWLFRNFDDCQKNNLFIYLFFSLFDIFHDAVVSELRNIGVLDWSNISVVFVVCVLHLCWLWLLH